MATTTTKITVHDDAAYRAAMAYSTSRYSASGRTFRNKSSTRTTMNGSRSSDRPSP